MTTAILAAFLAFTNPYFHNTQCATIDSTITKAYWTVGRSTYSTSYQSQYNGRPWTYRSRVPLVVRQAEAALKADPAKAKIVTICSAQH